MSAIETGLRSLFVAVFSMLFALPAMGQIERKADESTGVAFYEMRAGETIVRVAPDAGANVFSIIVAGVEYLAQPQALDKIAGVSCGVPVLYPTPNRVKDAKFSFGGKDIEFAPNAGKNFIHGLVSRYAWRVTKTLSAGDSAELHCEAEFSPDNELGKAFPFPHIVRLVINVSDRRVRWTYQVDNQEGRDAVPFGFALHPYFAYQGERKSTYLTIPATHWMESENQLPSGRLVKADDLQYALNEPVSLGGLQLDDVFLGVRPDRPTLIEFRQTGHSVQINASHEFGHLVVWTPDRPFFGVESQTCSTDAHNLFEAGLVKESGLQVCPPGESRDGWVEYEF